MFILTENPSWMAEEINNFLWACFTRTNPSHDMEGVDSFIDQKHWGSNGPLIFDARIKKHHAPPVEKNAAIEKKVDVLLAKYGY